MSLILRRQLPGPAWPMSPQEVVASFLATPGLYIHIPFCKSICPFCPYNKVLYEASTAKLYMGALRQELQRYLRVFDGHFSSVYIGGGTPTLCLDELGELLSWVPVAAERAIEVLPTDATPETLAKLQAMGITHVSIGAQSFDENVLRHLGRPHTVSDNRRALENCCGRFACVDVDLIFDAAFGTPSVFLRDCETAFRAGVDQVSTYPLMRFGYTPFGKAKHRGTTEHRVLRETHDLAHSLGYERRSVWTFNRCESPGYSSITRDFYLGLGAGAASYTGGLFTVNHFSVDRYIEELARDRLPIARARRMSAAAAALYYLFWRAYGGRLEQRRFEKLFPGQRWMQVGLWLLRLLGYARAGRDAIFLTPRGYDLYHDLERWVTYVLIEPLWEVMMQQHHGSGHGDRLRAHDVPSRTILR